MKLEIVQKLSSEIHVMHARSLTVSGVQYTQFLPKFASIIISLRDSDLFKKN